MRLFQVLRFFVLFYQNSGVVSGYAGYAHANDHYTLQNMFEMIFLSYLKDNSVHSQEADTDENQGSLTFEEFCTFYKLISTRRDLYLLMITYSNHKEHMDVNDLHRFLENEQKAGVINFAYHHVVIC